MPRTRKEVRRKTVLTKNGRLSIVVYMRERRKKGGIDYYTEAYSINAERITGISTQEYRSASSRCLENEVIDRIIARTVEKYEAKELLQREKIDYAAAFATIPEESYGSLCPPNWSPSEQKKAIKYFVKNSIAIIQSVLDVPAITEATLLKAQNDLLCIVKGNQKGRKNSTADGSSEDDSEQNVAATARLDASAQNSANRRLVQLNLIYQASRLLLPEYDLPPLQLPRIIQDEYVPLEQCKSFPLGFLVRLSAIFELELEENSLAVGGSLMSGCMLRPSETCAPKFDDIFDFGTFGVYAVRTKVDSDTIEVVDALKTTAAHRTIVIPNFAMCAIRRRKTYLSKCGLTEKEICNAFVVSQQDNPFIPANPRALSYYVKQHMKKLGCGDGFWESISMLMSYEPDLDEHGRALADPTAYSLRRAICSYLMNCAAAPRLLGEKIPLSVLVDILMGHELSARDRKWMTWANRQDNWSLIAQMMETIILNPEHSAHPAFAPMNTALFPKKICHTVQRLSVPEGSGKIMITIQAHSTEDIVVRFSQQGKAVSHEQVVLSKEASSMPIIQETIDRSFYEKLINDERKKFDKERGDPDVQDTKPVQGP